MSIECRRAISADELAECMSIRDAVFVAEQNVPPELERDGLDDDCLHYLVCMDGAIIGTARVLVMADMFKFQRVAVLPAARGAGVGGKLMAFMMADLAQRDDAVDKQFFLSSQMDAVPFYQRLGFEVCSDIYLDAGIEHRDMKRPIAAST